MGEAATLEEQKEATSVRQPLGLYEVKPQDTKEVIENPVLSRVASLGQEGVAPTVQKDSAPLPPVSPKPTHNTITGVLSPKETIFKLRATALEKQVADLTKQVEELINKTKEEKEKGEKAVLKATIESKGNVEKLQSLVQMQREELLNLRNSLDLEMKNSKEKDTRINELETALAQNDTLLATIGNNSYFSQGVAPITEISTDGGTPLVVSSQREEKPYDTESAALLQELLTELEETTEYGRIKEEIDSIAAKSLPENVSQNPATLRESKDTNVVIQSVETGIEIDTDVSPASTQVTQITEQNSTISNEMIQEGAPTVSSDMSLTLDSTSAVKQEEVPPTEDPSLQQENHAEDSGTVPALISPINEEYANKITGETKDLSSEEQVTLPEKETTTSPLPEQEKSVQTISKQDVSPKNNEDVVQKEKNLFLSKETISALFAAAPIATPESYLVSPFGFLSKETAARDIASFPENLIKALDSKDPSLLIEKTLYDTYQNTLASDIYLSGGSFAGNIEERVKVSAFIRSLLGFFLPNHIATLPDNETRTILSTATVSTLWITTCELYEEEKAISSSSLTSLIMEQLGLTAAAIEEKQATLREIVDTVYAKFLNPLLGRKSKNMDDDETVSPILEALRKAFEMDEKEVVHNKTHNYQFFMIALKNFLLRENERREIVKLFEEAREETLSALTENDSQKAEILRLFENAKKEVGV